MMNSDYAYIIVGSILILLLVFAFFWDKKRNLKRKKTNQISIKAEEAILKNELVIIAKVYFVIAAVQEIKHKHQQKVDSEILNTRVARMLGIIVDSEEINALKPDLDKYVAMNQKIAKLMTCDCQEWEKKARKELNFFQKVYILNSNVTKPILQKFSKEYKRFIFNF